MECLRMHLDSIQIYQDTTLDRIGGTIYFSIGDTYFPDEGWYDLVSEDFLRWLPDLISFAFNHTDSCILYFMDGPAQVKYSRRNGTVTAVCMYDGCVKVPETEIDMTEWNKSVLNSIKKYNRLLHEQGLPPQFANERKLLKEAISMNENDEN